MLRSGGRASRTPALPTAAPTSGRMALGDEGPNGRYAIFDPDYPCTIRDGIDDVVGELLKKAGTTLHPNITQRTGTSS